MKTVKILSSIGVVTIAIFIASGCAKDKSSLTSLPKSSQLAVKLLTIKSTAPGIAVTKGMTTGTKGFALNSVKISIANLTIEENSGNDVQQQGNINDGGTDKENKGTEGKGAETSDVLLAGPYILDVVDGNFTIGQVNVYPGTFKKVDFTFLNNNDVAFGGNSIIVNGSYQKADGTILPVVLKSDFNQQVQLPLANGGLIVAANSTIALSIVLDIPAWINSLNLSSAIVSSNEIVIDKTNNPELLKLFEAYLTSGIEVEN